MATPIYLWATETMPYESVASRSVTDGAIRDALSAASTGTALAALADTVDGDTEVRLYYDLVSVDPYLGWYSERIDTQVTISGSIAVSLYAKVSVGTVNAKLRMKLWKRTAGGSEIDSFIGQGDGTIALTTTTANHTITITPATPVTVAPDERFIIRLYAIPVSGTLGAGVVTAYYNGTVANSGEANVTFTETILFAPNKTTLYLRRTKGTGIGVFRDLLPTVGVTSFLTGSTRILATDSQWTENVNGATVGAYVATIGDTSNATSYTTGSFTPGVNTLYLLAVVHSDAAPETTIPTITTTTGLTFVQVGSSVPFDTIASNVHRITLFRAMKASGLSAGTVTVNLADAGTGCAAQVIPVTGVVTTGTDGADAVRNIVTGSANANANPSITLGSFASSLNGVFACFGFDVQSTPTAGTGFSVAGGAMFYATPDTTVFTQWNWQNATTVDCALAAADWGGIACELVADPTGTGETLEWITPRLKRGVTLAPLTGSYSATLYASESNTAANATPRMKLARWRAGVETEIVNAKVSAAEMSTIGGTFVTLSPTDGGQITQTDLLPDDRLLLRVFVTNAGSQTVGAGYSATLRYDHSVATATSRLVTVAYFHFKTEAEPDDDPADIPGGLAMGGIGL